MGEVSLLPLESLFNALKMFYFEPKEHFAESSL